MIFYKISTAILLIAILIQWFVLSFLIAKVQHLDGSIPHKEGEKLDISNSRCENEDGLPKSGSAFEGRSTAIQQSYEGVAATLMINSPKWFQRRYTSMIENALSNTPPSWAVQIFYTPSGQSQFGLNINPGIARLASTHSRLVLTELPADMVKKYGMKKKKLFWTSEFLWQSMLAQNVLVFSGNGCICSNSKISLLDGTATEIINGFHFIGAPTRNRGGEGGDGSLSFRKKSAMLDVIRNVQYDGDAAEDFYFIKGMKELNKKNGGLYKIATKKDTNALGGINVTDFKEENGPPFLISGTLPNLDHSMRNVILELCPDIKRIFPSLHNPNCFGAHPDAEGCAKSICALQDVSVRGNHGC